MGDRTDVTLTIIKEHEELAQPILETYGGGAEVSLDQEGLISLFFEEVNYGELPFLNLLEEQGIPYDSDWGDGGEYKAGYKAFRIDENGAHHFTEVSNNDTANTIELSKLNRICESQDLTDSEKLSSIKSLMEETKEQDNPPFTLEENRAILFDIN